jgi:hypothetical protein
VTTKKKDVSSPLFLLGFAPKSTIEKKKKIWLELHQKKHKKYITQKKTQKNANNIP